MKIDILKISKIYIVEIFLKLLLGLIGIILGRVLSISEFSIYFFYITIINLPVNIVSNTFNKYIFTKNNLEYIEEIGDLYPIIIQSILCIIILYITSFFDKNLDLNFYIIILFIVIVKTLYLYYNTKLQVKLLFRKIYLRESVRVLTYFSSLSIFYYLNREISIEYILFFLFLSFIPTFLFRYDTLLLKISIKDLIPYLKSIINNENIYLFLSTVIMIFITTLDTLMLKYFSDDYQLANFGVAFTMYSLVILGLSSVHKYLLPNTKMMQLNKFEDFIKPFKRLVLLLVPLILTFLFLSRFVIDIIYGDDKYQIAHIILNILLVSSLISLYLSPYSNVLIINADYKYLLKVYTISTLLLFISNIFFIPKYGAIYVAISNLLCYTCIHIFVYIKSKNILRSSQ